jgi:hypothetical protein
MPTGADELAAPPRRVTIRAPAIAALGLLATLGAGAVVAAAQRPDQDRGEYGPVKAVNAAVERALGPTDRTILVNGTHDFTGFDFRAAVIYDLRRRGLRVLAPAASLRLGSYYDPDGRTPDASVYVFDERRPPKSGRVIARVSSGEASRKTITVMVSRATGTPSRPVHRPAPASRRAASRPRSPAGASETTTGRTLKGTPKGRAAGSPSG